MGVLLSGRGSNFEALAASVEAGRIPNAEIAILLSNQENAPGLERARARGIAARAIPSKGLEREAYDRQMVAALNSSAWPATCGCFRRISFARFRTAS
jgi:phosphoribosylglycinamide formyltransferase-1